MERKNSLNLNLADIHTLSNRFVAFRAQRTTYQWMIYFFGVYDLKRWLDASCMHGAWVAFDLPIFIDIPYKYKAESERSSSAHTHYRQYSTSIKLLLLLLCT